MADDAYVDESEGDSGGEDVEILEDQQYLPLEKAKSPVWEHFGFKAKDGQFEEKDKKKRTTVYCKVCKNPLSYKGNTTNMMVHLRNHHKAEFEEVTQKIEAQEKEKATTSSEAALQPGQRTIEHSFELTSPISRNSAKWKTLTNSICYCITKDMLPINTINDSGFRYMLSKFEPRYTPPDRSTIARNFIPAMYEREKSKVSSAISSDMQSFAITTDGWTSRSNCSYVSLTVHYISKDWEMCCHLLETAEVMTDHTAPNLAAGLKDSLERWKLPLGKLTAAVTDNARNICLALEILDVMHVGCFAHTIQLGVQKVMDLPEMSKAIGRAKRLVSHFNHSCKSSYVLRRKQHDLKHDEQCLIQSVPTRWNSAYYMLERILKQQQPLFATLIEIHKSDLMPSDAEITAMEAFVAVMDPIVNITEVICGEKWVTLSGVRPLLYKLTAKHLVEASSDSRLTKQMKRVLLADLQGRYTDTTVAEILHKACFLDPRFKSLSFLSEEIRESVVLAIEEEATVIANLAAAEDERNGSSGTEGPVPKKKKQSKFMSLLEDVWEPEVRANPEERAKREVKKYICIDIDPDQKPLLWWKQYCSQLPVLSKLAHKYLCIPATSVSSERAFSTAGHVINSKRSCLLPEHANMLVFLAQNLK